MKFHLGGDMSKHLAPNGKPSNLTHEQWHLVRTPEFKAWFGDWENDPENASKVVDENGEPLVVYHGTKHQFTIFRDTNVERNTMGNSVGMYFTSSELGASRMDWQGNYIKVFLNIKNLVSLKKFTNDDFWFELLGNDLKKAKGLPDRAESYWFLKNGSGYRGSETDNVGDVVKELSFKKGIDGYLFPERMFNDIPEIDVYVAFEPNQIKLADGTNTTFDGSNPDIRYDDGGRVEDLIGEGIVDLKMYDTTPEHAKEYGLQSINPLYIQTICVSEPKRLKGLGKKVLAYIEKYAIENGHDVVFGHITQKAKFTKDERETFFCDIDMIKNWLHSNGYAINDNNNDFHKVISYSNPDIRYNNGGTMKKVDKGGITYGKSHDEGGIPVKNASTGQMLEVEGGEGIVNKRSMASDKKVKMNGKEMTICEAVSQLNQMEGGVKFSCDDVEHRQFIEAMELGGELERGIRTEKEHIDTLRKLYENRLTPNEAITEIAKEHIAESPTYYSDLEKNNLNKIAFSESANKLGMSEQSLSELIYDMQGKFFRSRFDTEPIEKPDFEDEDDLSRYSYGGQTKSDCGCSHSPKKYMDGGIFDSGFGSLDSFLGGLEEKNQNKKDAEYSFEVIEYARKLLDKDYKYDLINGLPPKYKVYFENLKEANLYKVGWRFKYGSSRQWAGLCAYNGLVFDKGKTLYLSINFVKHDENWKQNETDTILHEMAHAFVSEFIKTKIPASSFNELDPTDAALEGHGEAFTEVCKALNPNGDCGRFYTKSNLKPSFLPFMYECAFCGVKKYSQNRNFTTICYQCNKPVIVIKND